MASIAVKTLVPSQLISQKIYFVRGTRVMLDADRTTKPRAIPCRFHVSGGQTGPRKFEITICNLKAGRTRRPTLRSLLVYGTRCGDVVQRAQEPTRSAGERRDHADIRSVAGNAGDPRRKIDAMEKRYDARVQAVFETIRQMLETPVPMKKAIGFHAKPEAAGKRLKALQPVVSNRK